MLNAVIYARYSSDSQREESIDGQLRECKAFAEKNGMTVLRNYIDRAFSAKTDNRPEFQNMVKDSSKHLFDVVIVWKLDRFARNRYDSAKYKATLRKNGAKVVSATEVISEGSEGILLESLLEGYAEYYSADLAEKVIRGRTDNALKCKFNGGTIPIGYIINDERYFQFDPITAPLVLEAFALYDKGATMSELVKILKDKGLKTTKGSGISINVINRLLKNRRYIGEYQYREILNPEGIPVIVPKDLFDRVQERMAKNKKAPARYKAEDNYLLTTKLFCGKCGAYMVGESGTSHSMKVHHYYKCVTAKNKKGCDKKTVKKDWIEDLVIEQTMKMVFNDTLIDAIAESVINLLNQESNALPLLQQQLVETNRGIQNLLNAIQQGILTSSTKQRLDELEAAKSDLEVRILQEKMVKPTLTKEQLIFWLSRFRKLDVTQNDQRQRLIDTFVNAIYLYDDKIVFIFNYKDGSKTITFDQVNGSDLESSGAPKDL